MQLKPSTLSKLLDDHGFSLSGAKLKRIQRASSVPESMKLFADNMDHRLISSTTSSTGGILTNSRVLEKNVTSLSSQGCLTSEDSPRTNICGAHDPSIVVPSNVNGAVNAGYKVKTSVWPSQKILHSKVEAEYDVQGQEMFSSSTMTAETILNEKTEHLTTKRQYHSTRKCDNTPPKLRRHSVTIQAGQSPVDSSLNLKGASGIDHKQLVAVANSVHVAKRVASASPYWSKMENIFASVSPEDLDFLNKQMNVSFKFGEWPSEMLVDENATLGLKEKEADSKKHENDKGQVSVDSDPLFQGAQSMSRLDRVPSLTQRVLSALIDEDEVEDLYNQNEAPDNCNESSSNGCLPFPARGDFPEISKEDSGSKFSSKLGTSDISSCSSQYQMLPLDDKIRMELQSIGIPLDSMPCPPLEEKSVDQETMELKVELDKQGIKKAKLLSQIDEAIQRESQEEKKNVEQVAMNLLLITAYKKLMASRGGNSSRKAASKVVEGKTKAFVNRTLVRYKEYESTGKSCFSEPELKEVLFSPPREKDMKSALSRFRRNFSVGCHKKATRRKSCHRYKAKSGASNAGKAAASSSGSGVQTGDSSGSRVHLKRSSSVASLKDDSSSGSGRVKRKKSVSEVEVLHAPKAIGNSKRSSSLSSSSRRRGENGSTPTTTTSGIMIVPSSAECCGRLKNKAAEEEEVDDVLARESELHEVPISEDPAIKELSNTVSVVATEKAPL
ncbi:PREDICTED: uncharacterized protein LOC109169255 isoform X2 [Ipomoea nil]|uniref:uncharacterized protein LOC109169255 isoform X2 n=1 Tax=Ipomoea nil TaxID=35883 RepID=UPI000900DBA6|nr:PREDICTED: uncharacterized protein LOC109169255 isoform X2 [Ipomoea nil]